MANVPTPRSFNAIVGNMLSAFLGKLSIPKVKQGSPVLSIMEAAAMSDFRSSQDIFQLLNSTSLDNAQGAALLRIGADEKLPLLTELPASGVVSIRDSRITKISTRIYQGLPAPIVGSMYVNVVDASAFAATGSIYLGRGTVDLEGPLAYTSIANNGSYFTLTLTNATTRFHNLGESVILAQGGDRIVLAGAVAQTPAGNASTSVSFATLYPTTIADGEDTVEGVIVTATTAGLVGNVPAGSINSFASAPFPGATVTNPAPFSNGRATESDDEYRERIKNAKASRSLGTELAVTSGVTGLTSADENKRIQSASLVKKSGFPTVLYIDDGTGYEERSMGIAVESLNDSAVGGERYFQTSQRPVAKAFVESGTIAPFNIAPGSVLSAFVGGVLCEHTFTSDQFRNISSATAYEISASVNSDANLGFGARTSNGGTKVVLFATADTNEDIQVVDDDANDVLLFATRRIDTMRLYQNDVLLSKDGKAASVSSRPFALWNTVTSPVTLELGVDDALSPDGTSTFTTFTFTDQDFIAANTGFNVLAKNSVDAWAAVFNRRLAGVTATVAGSTIVLTSNRDRSSSAVVDVIGGTLVGKIFDLTGSRGEDFDYQLDRNTAQIRLQTALSVNDRLTIGSINTRAFLETPTLAPVTITGSGGNLWLGVDGTPTVVATGITAATTFSVTDVATYPSWHRYRITCTTAGVTPFLTTSQGDWLIIWDPATAWISLVGNYLISVVDPAGAYIEIETKTIGGFSTFTSTFPNVGVAVVGYSGQIQQVAVAAAPNYTAQAFSALLNGELDGASASVYKTTKLRLRTNTFNDNGDVGVVTADLQGVRVKLPIETATNKDSQLASVESGNGYAGTPDFTSLKVSSSSANNSFNFTGSVEADKIIVGVKNLPVSPFASVDRFGNNRYFKSAIEVLGSSPNVTLRNNTYLGWLESDRFYVASPFALGPEDTLVAVVDSDVITKRYVVPTGRTLKTIGSTYAGTSTFRDQDGSSLARAFGLSFDFNDFAVYMHARTISHQSDSTKSILWRYATFGAEGNQASIAYQYPTAANSSLSLTINRFPASDVTRVELDVGLPSGVAKTYRLLDSVSLGYGYHVVSSVPYITVVNGFQVSSLTRASNVVTASLTMPSGAYAVTNHSIPNGTFVWFKSSDEAHFVSGLKHLTAVTSTTVTWAETGTDITVGGLGVASISTDTNGEDAWVPVGGTVAVDDVINLTSTAVPAAFRGLIKITNIGPQFIQGRAAQATTDTTTLTYQPIVAASNVSIYSLSSTTAGAVVTYINGLTNGAVTATLLGSGTGVISQSTLDGTGLTGHPFHDGINWVRMTTAPMTISGDYSLTFKNPIESTLATGSDWVDEDVRIVPTTIKNCVEWFNTPAVSGLFSVASVSSSSQGQKLQIASLTAGSIGSVQVQGGTAQIATAALVGGASTSGSVSVVTVRASDSVGFHGDYWVSVDNSTTQAKTGVFAAGTILNSIAITTDAQHAVFTFDTGGTPVFTQTSSTTDQLVQVEKQGNFVAYVGYDASAMTEGDWVFIAAPTTSGNNISDVNKSIYRVVRSTTNGFWIENPNAVEEAQVKCNIKSFTSDSLMPGDTVNISTNLWDSRNKGVWTVDFVGDVPGNAPFATAFQFRVLIPQGGAIFPVSTPVTLGSESGRVQAIEASPTRLIKHINSIFPSQVSPGLMDIKFDTVARANSMTTGAGSVVSALNKFNFPQGVVQGLDGYAYNVGLVAEASKVVYGVASDTSSYPGIAAVDSNINITGPLVKRISVSLSIRIKLGVSTIDIANRVKSSVASVINSTGIGQSIAFSDIVSAAQAVTGVRAVTIISPTYGIGEDVIAVQPFEKPLVLNVDQDVTVAFVGE